MRTVEDRLLDRLEAAETQNFAIRQRRELGWNGLDRIDPLAVEFGSGTLDRPGTVTLPTALGGRGRDQGAARPHDIGRLAPSREYRGTHTSKSRRTVFHSCSMPPVAALQRRLEVRPGMPTTSMPSATLPIQNMKICASGVRSGSIPTSSIALRSRPPSTHCRKHGSRAGAPRAQSRRQAPIKRAAALRLSFIVTP